MIFLLHIFHIFVTFFVISLLKMASKYSPEVLSSVPVCKKAVTCLWGKRCVLGKFLSGIVWLCWVQGRDGASGEILGEYDPLVYKYSVHPWFSSGKMIIRTTKKKSYKSTLSFLGCPLMFILPAHLTKIWVSVQNVFFQDANSHRQSVNMWVVYSAASPKLGR